MNQEKNSFDAGWSQKDEKLAGYFGEASEQLTIVVTKCLLET